MSQAPRTLGFLSSIERGRVRLRCIPCRRDAYFRHVDLAAFFGERVTFEALKVRAYCRRCGRKVDDDLVTFELDLEPPSREELLANMWGGFGGGQQLEQLRGEKASANAPKA